MAKLHKKVPDQLTPGCEYGAMSAGDFASHVYYEQRRPEQNGGAEL
jgi:hypothetical protein